VRVNTEITTRRADEAGPPQGAQTDSIVPDHAPRKLSFAENVVLTIKVLTVAAVLVAALWGINVWTSAR
jgi:hypothetical protein